MKLNLPQTKLHYHRLVEESEKLKKQVNPNVNEMAQQAEQEYEELIKKRDKMVCDKDTIQSQIEKLDALKSSTLMGTYQIVNQAFQNIFATLLPGA